MSTAKATENVLPITIRRQVVENILLVFLDDHTNEKRSENHTQIRQFINSIEIFTNPDECVDFVTDIKHNKVFLIVSIVLGKYIVPVLHEFSQICSIYLLYSDESQDDKWSSQYTKVKGTFIDTSNMCDVIKMDTKRADRDLTAISIFGSPSEDSSSEIILNEIDPKFMYSQFLNEILLKMEFGQKEKHTFTHFCRLQYADNPFTLRVIHEFDQEYERHDLTCVVVRSFSFFIIPIAGEDYTVSRTTLEITNDFDKQSFEILYWKLVEY